MRTAGSAFFVLFALVLGLVALPSAWLAFNVINEGGFVEFASPLTDDAEVTGALAEALAEEAATSVELPPDVTGMVKGVLEEAARDITQLPEFDQAWEETLRRSHILTFRDEVQAPNDSGEPAMFTLDVAPLLALVTAGAGGQLGADISAPDQTLLGVGGGDQRAVLARVEAAGELWPALSIASGVGAVLALALARRRSTTLGFLGLGILFVGAGLWLTAGLAPGLVNQVDDDVALADIFGEALAARAAADFQEWCLAVLAGGVLLMVAGIVGRLLSGSRR